MMAKFPDGDNPWWRHPKKKARFSSPKFFRKKVRNRSDGTISLFSAQEKWLKELILLPED
jgi:hypothetical protein